MNGIKNEESSSHRSLSESQFRWRAAPPNEPVRSLEQGSRGKIKNGARRELSQRLQEEGPVALGLKLPSSVLAAYGERGRTLQEHREQSKERKRPDPSDKETLSTFIPYDQSGRLLQPAPRSSGSVLSERPRHQDVNERHCQRRYADQVVPRDRRPTSPPMAALATVPTDSALVKAASHQHPQLLPRPPATATATAPVLPPPQISQTSLDLQPAPSSSTSHVHPAVIQNSAKALMPIRILYEQAWYQTVSNVQNEMTRMHRELVDALDRERTLRSHLAQENQSLQQDLECIKADLRNARRDSDKFKSQCDRLLVENESLRQAAKDRVAPRGDRDDEVREAARSYIDERLKVQYGEQVEKQIEKQRMETERALEQHKAVFEKERRELHKIAVAQERTVQRSSSESASTLVASDTEKLLSPLYDQGSHKNDMQQESTDHDRPRGHRMSVSSGTRSPTSSRERSLSRHPTTNPEDAHVSHRHGSNQLDNATDIDIDVSGDLTSPTTSSIRDIARPTSRSVSYSPVSRAYSQSTSRSASQEVSPNILNSIAHPVLKVDISPAVPPITVLEESNSPSHKQQELPSSSKPLKTEPQSLSLLPQVSTHHRALKQPTPQAQQQQPRPGPLTPLPPHQQLVPPIPQLPQPAQPSKQPTAQSPQPPPPPPPPRSSQSRSQRPPRQPQQKYTYQSRFPEHNQTDPQAWVSYPYACQYQYTSPPPPPLSIPSSVPAAPLSTSATPRSTSVTPQSTPTLSMTTSNAFFSRQRKRDRVEYEEDSGAGERARAKVKLADKSSDGLVATAVEVKRTNKIGITHMDLLYETRGSKMICRMCRLSDKDEQQKTPTVTFPVDAKWAELIGHCQGVHPKSCADLEKLSPSQVQELRQRMQSGKLTGYTLKS
ncbi:hypothetical protein E4T56_gene15889 [Termitomyces sp. T112]|nr:hypothetical protein E4T56_gene15889 [Termitomyces sp. T112]KAH0586806.1 hypothetical protein H2248_005655 [Termitomyces sp. 'cryptogamus']